MPCARVVSAVKGGLLSENRSRRQDVVPSRLQGPGTGRPVSARIMELLLCTCTVANVHGMLCHLGMYVRHIQSVAGLSSNFVFLRQACHRVPLERAAPSDLFNFTPQSPFQPRGSAISFNESDCGRGGRSFGGTSSNFLPNGVTVQDRAVNYTHSRLRENS